MAVSECLTHILAIAVLRSVYSWIHFSFSLLLKKCVSCLVSTASFFLDHRLHNASRARTLSACKQHFPSFAGCRHLVDRFVDLLNLLTGNGEMFFLWALTIVSCIYFVVGQDVGCCKRWTTWRKAVAFMSRLLWLINWNKTYSAYWLSIHLEWHCYHYNMTWYYKTASCKIVGISEKKTLLHVPSVVECYFYILQWWDFCCRSPLCTSLNKWTTLDRHTANYGTLGYPWNLHLYAVVFILSTTCKLAVTHFILTGS